MRTLPAAAIPKGSVVMMSTAPGERPVRPVEIAKVHNADPQPGRIRWETSVGSFSVGGAERIEVVSLP